ncbi:signal recognition particle-docking protein FtsY [[Acholeplasma] multilocale]|uniref:signal recognition particle-docking protein FtsY n=1 Tax=[Acholeplasma] multilocale TaxID=264638 RepID=UPI00047B7284|nr:signal recognition particle-docking protein FtsY [[Acholeplasma] multilocale]
MGFWSKLKDKVSKKDAIENIKEEIIEIIDEQPEVIADEIMVNDTEVIEENFEKTFDDQLDETVWQTVHLDTPTPVEQKNEELEVFEEQPEEIETISEVVEEKFVPTKKEIKQKQKELKRKQKEAVKKEKAEKVMLKSALDFSKDIKKLSKKYKEADDDFFEELEELLIKTDMGMKMVIKISTALQKRARKTSDFNEIKELLIEELYDAYVEKDKKAYKLNFVDGRLNIFMVVGVNGTGKTTSLSKIANYYAEQGKKVLIAAGDTFRAGAVEQLEEWVSTRLDNSVDLIRGKKNNQDPASVVYDAIEKAQAEGYDLLLIDTAGRLQNKVNLMKELEKMHQIVHKFDKAAPHELLLVIDATTGQNGVIQAESFSEVTKVTGIVLTKMDGTSKGGIALAIKDQLNIPVKLMGIGEQVDDIIEFDVEQYVYGLAAGFMEDTTEVE